MINDTLTAIEDRFFDGLQTFQQPAIAATRQTATALGALPIAGDLAARNLAFAQRLLDLQQAFVTELVGATTASSTSKRKRSGD